MLLVVVVTNLFQKNSEERSFHQSSIFFTYSEGLSNEGIVSFNCNGQEESIDAIDHLDIKRMIEEFKMFHYAATMRSLPILFIVQNSFFEFIQLLFQCSVLMFGQCRLLSKGLIQSTNLHKQQRSTTIWHLTIAHLFVFDLNHACQLIDLHDMAMVVIEETFLTRLKTIQILFDRIFAFFMLNLFGLIVLQLLIEWMLLVSEFIVILY